MVCMGEKESRQMCNLISAVVVFSLVCLCMYGIMGVYSFSLFPDEFGYWACAAKLLGYDFSEVASIGSYYSFGYSLILTPIFLIFQDSIICYRAAVVVNLFLQILSYFIMSEILDRFAEELRKPVRLILAGVYVLYPSWVFYTQMTMSEALLFFLYTLIVYLVILYLEKPTILRGILLAVCSVYIYTVHMRTVGVLLSVFLMVLAELVIYKERNRKSAAITLIILVAGFLAAFGAKDVFQSFVFNSGPVDSTYINDYSGQTGKFAEILLPKGFAKFFVSMSGKILYLGCATFGSALIGVRFLINRKNEHDRAAIFILTASALEFLIMCIYLLHSADTNATRFDLFLHGRYFDFAIPLLAVIGIFGLIRTNSFLVKLLFSNCELLLCSVIAIFVCAYNRTGMNDPHGTLMIGMSYFLDEENVQPMKVIILSVLFAIGGSFLLAYVIYLFREKHNIYALICIPVCFMALGYQACNHFIYISQSYAYGDVQVADKISELRTSGYDGDIVMLYEGGLEYIDTVQFRLRDEHIKVYYPGKELSEHSEAITRYLEDVPEDAIVLVDFESGLNEFARNVYDKSWESGHFNIYYNCLEGDT